MTLGPKNTAGTMTTGHCLRLAECIGQAPCNGLGQIEEGPMPPGQYPILTIKLLIRCGVRGCLCSCEVSAACPMAAAEGASLFGTPQVRQ
jgi:hypothetical protein